MKREGHQLRSLFSSYVMVSKARRKKHALKRPLFVLCSLLGTLSLILAPTTFTAGTPEFGSTMLNQSTSTSTQSTLPARYIVQLSDPPLASYRGGVPGLAATNPAARGEVKLSPTSTASRAYLDYLSTKQAGFLAAAAQALGRPVDALFRYRYAYNGVAVSIAPADVGRVAALPGVRKVRPDFTRRLLTDAGPTWIGAPGIWSGSSTGGLAATKGEGVVVGVIDTGINHDHPSFADVGGDGYDHTNPRGTYYGLCDPVLGLPFCNEKLIGVWDFTGTTPEDDNEHGSHTASTAAGNALSAAVNAPTISIARNISGVAPHANLITYKACIAAGCVGTSLTAAIDQATADAVDVINYSIGGGSTDPWADADSEAFLGARDAGIFVSASAGNDGPRPETIGSPANAPWLMSIGASTHNRKFANAVTGLSGGGSPPADISGASFTSGFGPAPIVYAGDLGYPLCGDGPGEETTGKAAINPFLPGTFHGEIVVCDRGTYGRIEKAENVKEGGAGGFILANDEASGNSLVGDAYPLPGVHITYLNGLALKAWLASGTGHTGSIAGTTPDEAAANGDVMASFSSRGPDKSSPNVLKPDVTAPGVDVLAAIHTLGNTTSPLGSPEFGLLSGTSMSSPHSAGAAALVRALHPNWTPAEVQSAIMTTALSTGVRDNDGIKSATPFAMGAGRIDLTKAGRAGLVLDETAPRYLAANPSAGGDPKTLNIASLANADCRTKCSWTRVVEGTLSSSATWTAKTSAPAGMVVTVSPSKFTLAPGATQTLTITADVSKVPVGKWLFATATLSTKAAPEAHLPIAVQTGSPMPVNIETNSTTGSETLSVTSGVPIQRFASVVSGLAEGKLENLQLEQDPTSGGIPVAGGVVGVLGPYDAVAGVYSTTIKVPAGARFLTADITRSTAPDVDLYVGLDQDGDGAPDEAEEICASASAVATESCKLQNPGAGTYWVLVRNWQGSLAGIDDIQLAVSTIPGTDNRNLTVTGPASSILAGQPFSIALRWNEPALAPGAVWFALVEYGSDARHPNNAGSLLVKLTRTQ